MTTNTKRRRVAAHTPVPAKRAAVADVAAAKQRVPRVRTPPSWSPPAATDTHDDDLLDALSSAFPLSSNGHRTRESFEREPRSEEADANASGGDAMKRIAQRVCAQLAAAAPAPPLRPPSVRLVRAPSLDYDERPNLAIPGAAADGAATEAPPESQPSWNALLAALRDRSPSTAASTPVDPPLVVPPVAASVAAAAAADDEREVQLELWAPRLLLLQASSAVVSPLVGAPPRRRTPAWRALCALEWALCEADSGKASAGQTVAQLEAAARAATTLQSAAWGEYATYTLTHAARDDPCVAPAIRAMLPCAPAMRTFRVQSALNAAAPRLQLGASGRARRDFGESDAAFEARVCRDVPPATRLLLAALHWPALEAAAVGTARDARDPLVPPALLVLLLAAARGLPSVNAAAAVWPPTHLLAAQVSDHDDYPHQLARGLLWVARVYLPGLDATARPAWLTPAMYDPPLWAATAVRAAAPPPAAAPP